ncbi:MAG: cupin domain-containing protein [Ruminococcaceae bacterium]|nr:cupin domain-containing protein [Oscillospiraceae bacterium]
MASTMALDYKLKEMAGRIHELRDIAGFTPAEMAKMTGVTVEEYLKCEAGDSDLNFAFIYRCSLALNVDVTDIIEGASPKLSTYTLTRKGAGQKIEQAHGMTYYNLAPMFKKRHSEPLLVRAEYSDVRQYSDIELTTHEGQECDIVLEGSLKVKVGEHTEILNEGDSIYYDSSIPHGMIAVGGSDCVFYAIVLNPTEHEDSAGDKEQLTEIVGSAKTSDGHVWERFIEPVENEKGSLLSCSFKNVDEFNFAFDVVDVLGTTKPNKLAMLHLDRNQVERRFTFKDMKEYSARAANYFTSLGIKKGDKVMLLLKRNYQFWISMIALNKIGAVAIPATDQLLEKDLVYRIDAAGVSACICTAYSGVIAEMDKAAEKCPQLKVKISTCGAVDGWHDFDTEYERYRGLFKRTEDSPKGDDLLLMFFTSGTTGYPKIAAHSHKYPLGHFITARYWHCVDPEGLHLTISDTGWAKAMWGKLYGQWLNEAAVFVYDFDRFHANDILPLFAKHGITSFCAPPTMYRFLIKEDLSKYDLSSIKHATIAGEALNPEVFYQFKKATGLSVMEGFGQSETTVMIGNLIGMKPKPGSMGKPVPIYDIDLVDREGNPCKVGQTGEIVVKTANGAPCGLFREYYGNEEKTKEAWHDGYYHTGDTAWRDEDGYFWYVGRVDDLIKSSGYRIGPFEIESVIMELPYVLECGVSAAPDETRGQVVKASIVLTKGTEPTDELKKEIQTHVKKRTAPYKYPRIVVFRDELPKTTSGKIIRNKL